MSICGEDRHVKIDPTFCRQTGQTRVNIRVKAVGEDNRHALRYVLYAQSYWMWVYTEANGRQHKVTLMSISHYLISRRHEGTPSVAFHPHYQTAYRSKLPLKAPSAIWRAINNLEIARRNTSNPSLLGVMTPLKTPDILQ
jgi:hypothetical protein